MPGIEIEPTAEEPALVAAVRAYWTKKRGARAFPCRRDIVPSEIRQWLSSILLVDVVEGGADFRYRAVGSHLDQFFPFPPAGKLMSKALAPFGKATLVRTLEGYRMAMTAHEPLRIKGDGALYGQPPKYFDAILAPLSDDGRTVNMIFGAFDFHWNREKKVTATPGDEKAWAHAIAAPR